MTAQVSTNPAKPTNNFRTNYFIKVRSYLKLMIVLLVLHLVSAPMNLINLIVYSGKLEEYNKARLVNPNSFGYPEFNYLYPVIGVLATGLAVLMGVIIALGVYNYFYKKPNVDMVYALPLTTNQRFFSDFLAGATVYLLPYVISCVISLIIHGIGCMVQNTYTGQIVSRLSGTNDDIPFTQTLIYVMIAGFIIMLMTYTLTVLVMTCCGSLFESVAYNILVNILIPGTIAVFFFFMIGDLYGVNYLQSITELIVRTSPVGAVIGLSAWAFKDGSFYGWDSVNSGFWSIFGTVLLITAGMLALAWYLNKKRKPEQVSKPFVFKIFYYIMITCVTFCIGSLFTMNNEKANIIPMIIVSAIVYFIFELITNRGFKKFHMSVIRYAVTITAVLGLIWVSDATEGFGAVRKIPDADSVKSVTVTGISPFMFDTSYNYIYTLTENENIEAIVGVHQNVIDRYDPKVDKNTNVYVGMHHVYLTYNLKSGGKLSREYQLTTQEMLSLRNIERSEEYRKQLFKELSQKFNSDTRLTAGGFNFLSGEEFLTASDRAIVDEFLAALEADLASFSEEEYFEPSGEYLFPINVGFGCEFPITENHKNVLAFCQKYHPDFKSLLNYKPHQVEFMSDFELYAPEYLGVDVNGETLYASFGTWYTAQTLQGFNLGAFDKDTLAKILEHAQPYYITDEECYLIHVGNPGVNYIIPKEYSQLIKSYYNQYNAEWLKFTEKYPYCEEGGEFFTDDMNRGWMNYSTKETYDWVTKMIFNMDKTDHILLYATGGADFEEELISFRGTMEFPDGTLQSYETLGQFYKLIEKHGFVPAKKALEHTTVGGTDSAIIQPAGEVVY